MPQQATHCTLLEAGKLLFIIISLEAGKLHFWFQLHTHTRDHLHDPGIRPSQSREPGFQPTHSRLFLPGKIIQTGG